MCRTGDYLSIISSIKLAFSWTDYKTSSGTTCALLVVMTDILYIYMYSITQYAKRWIFFKIDKGGFLIRKQYFLRTVAINNHHMKKRSNDSDPQPLSQHLVQSKTERMLTAKWKLTAAFGQKAWGWRTAWTESTINIYKTATLQETTCVLRKTPYRTPFLSFADYVLYFCSYRNE